MRIVIGISAALVIIFVVLAALGGNPPEAQANPAAMATCAASDFSLSKISERGEYEYARLTGIVTNHCATSAGIQLKWTAYNSDGSVAFSSDFWPASTTNVPPHSDYAFEMMETAPRGDWTYHVEPIRVTVW